MSSDRKYQLGSILVHREDRAHTARVVAIKSLNGIEHYRVSLTPDFTNAGAFWISGFGLARDYAPRRAEGAADAGATEWILTRLRRLLAGQAAPEAQT